MWIYEIRINKKNSHIIILSLKVTYNLFVNIYIIFFFNLVYKHKQKGPNDQLTDKIKN